MITNNKSVGPSASRGTTGLKLGLVTYNLARDWDTAEIINNCAQAGFEAVELRTSHAHKVEIELSRAGRAEVRKQFEDSPVKLTSLGSTFEFHSTEQAELKRNIEGTREYSRLAKDVGADGIKVRPNGLATDRGIPIEKTLEQIGRSLHECGKSAGDCGVEIRLEVHGQETCRVPHICKILEHADSDNVFACWNSNPSDLEDGGLAANFRALEDKIHLVHMRDLYVEDYPWRELFRHLVDSGYDGYCCAEIPESSDPVRVMKYYRALFLALQDRL